jgi:hypothetical protein
MYDNLSLWFQLVQRFVSVTAFVEDDRVYIKEAGITEVPLFDPAVVMKLMNQHPHLLEDLYAEWRTQADEFNAAREFSIILFEDMLEQDQASAARAQLDQGLVLNAEEDAIADIVHTLLQMGFNVLNQTGNPRFGPKPEELIKSGGRFQL